MRSAVAMAVPRSWAESPIALHYWWEAFLEQDLAIGLIRDIEQLKGRQSAHELQCEQRQTAIHNSIADMKGTIEKVAKDVGTMATASRAAAWSINWKAWAIASAIILALLGGLGWTGGQLYALEPLRVAHATK